MDAVWTQEMVNSNLNGLTQQLLDTSCDEEEVEPPKWGGSRLEKAPNLERYRENGAARLYQDYFAASPVYNRYQFQCRFRITPELFHHIIIGVCSIDSYFTQRKDCTGRLALSTFQKITSAFRMLAYGSAADYLDECLRIGESTALVCLKRFTKAVVSHFRSEYLQYPTTTDIENILSLSERRGFPGSIRSIDCCKWEWKNCPTAFHGQYQGKEGVPTITLEAIANERLWIWHAFFGMPGSLNDINVLDAFPLSNEICSGKYTPPIQYEIAHEKRVMPYWLADGIYPNWPIFVHTVLQSKNKKKKLMARLQESGRKDVERAFGVLRAKWHIVGRPSRLWYKNVMHDVMFCCIILHNMMVEHRIIDQPNDLEDNDTNNSNIAVGGSAHLWSPDSASNTIAPPPGSIAALCALQKLTNNQQEYHKTRSLVMKHLGESKGTEFL